MGRLAQHRAASRPGLCAIAPGRRAGAPPVWKLTRSIPVQACKHPPAASLSLPRSGHWAPNLGSKYCPELTDHGLVPLRCGCAREPKRPGEARTAHPPASRREDSSREGPGWQALSGHKRSNTLAVELPPQARGTGTLIPSVRRLVWAGKPQLGNAAWGASFPSERALPAGGFGSVHTPSP